LRQEACIGIAWARDPGLTGGVLTRHHPSGPLVEGKKNFLRMTLDGGNSYILPIDHLSQPLDGELDGAEMGDKWIIEWVEWFQEECEALPDFTGH
jgi:hypothetical protein